MALTIDELKELIQPDEHRQLELKKTKNHGTVL